MCFVFCTADFSWWPLCIPQPLLEAIITSGVQEYPQGQEPSVLGSGHGLYQGSIRHRCLTQRHGVQRAGTVLATRAARGREAKQASSKHCPLASRSQGATSTHRPRSSGSFKHAPRCHVTPRRAVHIRIMSTGWHPIHAHQVETGLAFLQPPGPISKGTATPCLSLAARQPRYVL